jgi:hypothetical protein
MGMTGLAGVRGDNIYRSSDRELISEGDAFLESEPFDRFDPPEKPKINEPTDQTRQLWRPVFVLVGNSQNLHNEKVSFVFGNYYRFFCLQKD